MIKFHHIIITLIVGIVIGWLCRPNHIREVTKKVTDTLIIVDTHIIEKPVPIKRTHKETLYVAIHDTTHIKDSVFVPIPIEKKIYKGEDYLAEISGYNANLDRIEVYPKTIVTTDIKEVKYHPKNRLSAGAEVHYFGTVYTPLYIEYERMLHKNVGIYGRFLYDVPNNIKGVGVGVEFTIGW